MAQSDTSAVGEMLQFDRVMSEGAAPAPPSPVVVCRGCKLTITTEYYDVNGHALCAKCRAAATAAAETPRGMLPFLKATALGAGAAVVGAAIYYAVIAIAHLEIGIVAILIGYMVGYSVRRGARGLGGRRFQVLAVVLTYLAIALAYSPLAIEDVMHEKKPAAQTSGAVGAEAATDISTQSGENDATRGVGRPAPIRRGKSRVVLGIVVLSGLMLALPVLVVVGSFPYGLISAFIMFLGMWQSWKMTTAPVLRVAGPYRIGVPHAATS